MKSDIKKQWVEALRSGKYEQGRRHLKRYNRFCCLGVLCDLVEPRWITRNDGVSFCLFRSDILPDEIMDSVEMNNPRGRLPGLYDRNGAHVNLTMLNDDGMSFYRIADVIEYFF